jgi:hypothetical protein
MEDAYYWAIVGRIPTDKEDTPFCTVLPETEQEAVRQFLEQLREQDAELYFANGAIITAVFRSTEPIECMS